MAYRSENIHRGRLRSSRPGAVIRGKTLWVPEIVSTRNLWRAKEFMRVAIRAIHPFIAGIAAQEERVVILPQGRKPRRDVIK